MPFGKVRGKLGSSSSKDGQTPTRSASDSDAASVSTAASHNAAIEALKSRPLSSDPVQFVQDALAPMFTYNPKHDAITMEDLAEHHLPRYFANCYKCRVNTGEVDNAAWIRRMAKAREMCKKMRFRFSRSLIDTTERHSMQDALVSLQYEVFVTMPGRDEDAKIHGHGIYHIQEGKIASSSVVADMHEVDDKGPELACIIS